MMCWIAIVIAAFLGLRLLVALFNLISRPWLQADDSLTDPTPEPSHENETMKPETLPEKPGVSVLIPARNEAGSIGSLLEWLYVLHPPDDPDIFEVIVYDDMSEDNTAAIVNAWCQKDSRFKLLTGNTLPAGWLGKNHACHQLASESKGQYLLFLDADVSIKQGLIKTALAHLKKHNLALLSIFPQQLMKSFGERITVPLMNWILVSLLPLVLTRTSSWPSFSAANGQFMLFDAAIYRLHQFHEAVKHHKVEDIAIFRMMKHNSMKVQTLLSNGMIKCRMYTGFKDAVLGFSKNVFEFFGGSKIGGLAFALITSFGFIPIWMVWGYLGLGPFVVAALMLRILVSLASRQPIIFSVLLAPLQQMAFLVVISVAWYNNFKKNTRWKGRLIDN
jgi:glycosyltransferase involved in cell wall biosynthesis